MFSFSPIQNTMPENNELKIPVKWRRGVTITIYSVLMGFILLQVKWLNECHERSDRIQDKNDQWLEQFINQKLQSVEQKVEQKITEVDSLKKEISKP